MRDARTEPAETAEAADTSAGDDFLDADPQELARRDPSRTAAQWAAVQTADRVELYRRATLPVVNDPAEIPAFADEAEEAAFWETHEPGPGLEGAFPRLATAGRVPPLPPIDRTRLAAAAPKVPAPISLRLEADTLARLRRLAEAKGTRYQTLLKQFVVERLYEEEKREGLIAPAPSSSPTD